MWRTFFPCLGFILLLSACGSDPDAEISPPQEAPFTFQHQGLTGITVNRLYQQQDWLLAATSDGLYLSHGDGSWQQAGLAGYSLFDVVAITEQHFMASSYRQDDDGYFHYLLFESYNAGADWLEVKHQFGFAGEEEGIYGLLYDAEKSRLYASGIEVLAYSDDFGLSWQIIHGFWGGFGQPKSALAYHAQHNELWYGGQGAMENPVLFQIPLDGSEATIYPTLFPAPAVVYGIRFVPNDADTLYISGEGGIVKSTDYGNHWHNLLGDVDYRFYYDLAIDPADPQRLFTAGWDKKFDEPQPLILEWSYDGGANWQRYQYPAAASFYGGVRSMLLVQEQDATVLYLGLWRGGIMRVTPR